MSNFSNIVKKLLPYVLVALKLKKMVERRRWSLSREGRRIQRPFGLRNAVARPFFRCTTTGLWPSSTYCRKKNLVFRLFLSSPSSFSVEASYCHRLLQGSKNERCLLHKLENWLLWQQMLWPLCLLFLLSSDHLWFRASLHPSVTTVGQVTFF